MKQKLPGYMGGGTINKGGLHKSLGIPSGEKIPKSKIIKAEKSPNQKIKKQAVLAENFSKMNKSSSTPKMLGKGTNREGRITPINTDRGSFRFKANRKGE